jgi:hypothetical protein
MSHQSWRVAVPVLNREQMPTDHDSDTLGGKRSPMRATLYGGPWDISVGERPDPRIEQPTDAIVRVLIGCVCGSDMW